MTGGENERIDAMFGQFMIRQSKVTMTNPVRQSCLAWRPFHGHGRRPRQWRGRIP